MGSYFTLLLLVLRFSMDGPRLYRLSDLSHLAYLLAPMLVSLVLLLTSASSISIHGIFVSLPPCDFVYQWRGTLPPETLYLSGRHSHWFTDYNGPAFALFPSRPLCMHPSARPTADVRPTTRHAPRVIDLCSSAMHTWPFNSIVSHTDAFLLLPSLMVAPKWKGAHFRRTRKLELADDRDGTWGPMTILLRRGIYLEIWEPRITNTVLCAVCKYVSPLLAEYQSKTRLRVNVLDYPATNASTNDYFRAFLLVNTSTPKPGLLCCTVRKVRGGSLPKSVAN